MPAKPYLLIAICLSLSGCGILFGNVKPVTDRSEHSVFADLEHQDSDWKRNTAQTGPDQTDVSYQSQSTHAVISATSACRAIIEASQETLRDYTDQLVMGELDIESREEKTFTLQDQPALETTFLARPHEFKTKPNQASPPQVKIRSVVLRKKRCLYDLMYVAEPTVFDQKIKVFEDFVNSARFN